MTIRIIIVDDHLLIQEALRSLLAGAGDMLVVGSANHCADAISSAAALRPDIVLLDLNLDGESGLECITAITAAEPAPRVLVLTGGQDSAEHRRAIQLGASGVVHKADAARMLIRAIRRVHEGELWIDRALTSAIFRDFRQDAAAARRPDADAQRIATLTSRERNIIALVARGMNTPAIVEQLGISEKTVRNHLVSVYDKLGVHDRLALALYAAAHKLGEPSQG